MNPEARFWLEATLVFLLLFDGPVLALWWLIRRKPKTDNRL
ncbi:hypothetical protein P1X15_10145 [Runella sp. MFBS21]|nr:hypothetical protein [Runella sp. MFBS21]MDF7817959.1 hypothetical protein [Runella sp. MFBS21]